MAMSSQVSADDSVALAEEDFARAQLYRLLARLLARPATSDDVAFLASMRGDETELGRQIASLSEIAERVDAEDIPHEYHDLFIGLGRGELVPYESYYLTGFLQEKPLARLRQEMAELGIERDPEIKEPEDHIAALMDMMAGLILGAFGEPASLDVQRRFFQGHIAPWAKHFFRDLEGARSSVLYAAVGGVGRVFMGIEEVAFSMD